MFVLGTIAIVGFSKYVLSIFFLCRTSPARTAPELVFFLPRPGDTDHPQLPNPDEDELGALYGGGPGLLPDGGAPAAGAF